MVLTRRGRGIKTSEQCDMRDMKDTKYEYSSSEARLGERSKEFRRRNAIFPQPFLPRCKKNVHFIGRLLQRTDAS